MSTIVHLTALAGQILAQGQIPDAPTPWAWLFGQGVLGIVLAMVLGALVYLWRTWGVKFMQALLQTVEAIPADIQRRTDLDSQRVGIDAQRVEIDKQRASQDERHIKAYEQIATGQYQTGLAIQTIAAVMAQKSVQVLLLIEDSHTEGKAIVGRLERLAGRYGFRVQWIESLAGARDMWDQAALVVADLTVLDATARQMLDFLQGGRGKPIVFYTGNSDPNELREAGEIGAAVISKDDGITALVEAVAKVLKDMREIRPTG